MATCKYEACGATDEVDAEGACPKCAEIAAKIRDRILQGLLVRYQRQSHLDQFVGKSGKTCAACDKQILGESHWASGEVRFHEACREIWMKG